jgi:cell division protein FtsQ
VSPAHATSRRRRRGLVVAAVVVVVALALGGAGYVALHSRLFAATTVTVTGARHESPRAVVDAAGLAHAPSMLSVNPGAVAARVSRTFPWIASVTVTKHWPHTVTIALTERRAVAVVAGPRSTSVLVDATGRRLGPAAPHQVLPRLEYAVGADQQLGSPTSLAAAAQPGLLVAATLPPAFRSQVAVVQVSDLGWVTLHLTTPVSFVLGPASNLGAKYEDVAAVIARTTLHVGDVVDVSVPQAMTVSGP